VLKSHRLIVFVLMIEQIHRLNVHVQLTILNGLDAKERES